ncbi:MAG TPA: ribonuclease J [Candidatus Peribacterales bacterium]|nr:ribonuclease J [Candidatus Peribacterales bacterium]
MFRKYRNEPVPQQGGNSIVRIIPLGGFEEVGRNCMVIQVNEDLFLIDLGLQFPEEGMLGIDYLIPDISFLKGKEKYIRGVLFTHGHLDHIGAVQHLLPKLHFPTCYGTKLTMGFVKKRLDEVKLTSQAKLQTVEYGKRIKLGKVEVEWFRVTHSIPDSAGIAIHTPLGTIVHTGDFKFDLTPMNEPPADFAHIAGMGERGVLALISDSTNAQKPGHAMSERDISKTLDKIITGAPGRLIVSTFSSRLTRIQQIVDIAKAQGRKVFLAGRSMETNIEIAQNLGYFNAPRGLIRKVSAGMEKLPDREVMILTTGSQGEERAGLARMGLGIHRDVEIKKGDTVVLSSNPIIGNARAVASMINNLYLRGAKVLTNDVLDLHTTGHGFQEDLLLMMRLTKPKHVIPEHGEPSMRAAHGELAKLAGYDENSIHLLNNGEILEFDHNGNARRSKHRITANDIMVDGLGEGSAEGARVMEDRKRLANAGVVIVVLRTYAKSGRLVSDPDILSRGFVFGSELNEVMTEAGKTARKAYEDAKASGESDRKNLKKAVGASLHRTFRRKLDREPMVVPIFVEV